MVTLARYAGTMHRLTPSPRTLAALATALLAGGCLLQILAGYSDASLSGHAWGADDAYISYRYAENLAAGRGLVFNPGERVEGFSNLLYLLMLVPAAALVARDSLYAVAAGLNLVCAVAAASLLQRFARPRLGDAGSATLVLLFALSPSVWVAVASGLETPLVLLLQIATWTLVEQALDRQGSRGTAGLLGLVAALSVLARADGFITPVVAAAYLTLRARWRPALTVGAATLGTAAALVAFRLAYYGWPLPNTYYSKVVGGPLGLRLASGSQRLLAIALATGLLFHLVMIGVAAARGVRGASSRPGDPFAWLPFPLVFAAAWMTAFVYVGGDVFYDRFLICFFPMGGYLLLRLLRQSAPPPLAAALVVALVLAQQLVPLGTDPRFTYRRAKYDSLILLGRALGRQHPGALLATDAAGKIPYFSGLRTIDMLGLTDLHIGHASMDDRGYFRPGHGKSDLRYVLSRHPDLIAKWLTDDFSLRSGPVVEPEPLAAAGYRIAYLLNTDSRSNGRDLLDVRKANADEIRALAGAGYKYGVFAPRTASGEPRAPN
ncbi:MAG TPA: hypothetical protein VE075_04955 [Thermoanaerobaculia bacterium]|nr:hypothetical protein [Thermoanaerobaculia bacterium]